MKDTIEHCSLFSRCSRLLQAAKSEFTTLLVLASAIAINCGVGRSVEPGIAMVSALMVAATSFVAIEARAEGDESRVVAAKPVARFCSTYSLHPERVGSVPDRLGELSGMTASRRHPGVYWAHNDSGNPFEVFALREDGSVLARFDLVGGTPRDIEDIAVGPCDSAGDSCIYLADIGDNREVRESAVLWRVREPDDLRPRELAVERLAFRYADGPHNAEALLVEPDSLRAFVLTKTYASLGRVYRIEGLAQGVMAKAVPVGEISSVEGDGLTTSASLHPAGGRILLRTYRRAWELRLPGERSLEKILKAAPVEVPRASQPQAEAVSYTPDGDAYLLAGEGEGSPVFRVKCQSLGSGGPDGASLDKP